MTIRRKAKPDPLTSQELIVLIIIKLYGPALYSKQIMEISNGMINKGNVYVIMNNLFNRGLLRKKGGKTAAPNSNYMVQYYTATAKGKRALVGWQQLLSKLMNTA